MKIGTLRPEEARIYDDHAGYHSFHEEETQEEYGSYEIFWHDGKRMNDGEGEPLPAGWYWAAGFPGCLWDGEPSGPFGSSFDARRDADEWDPYFDDF